MKSFLLALFLLSTSVVFCTPGDTTTTREKREHRRDSVIDQLKKRSDSLVENLQLTDTALIKQQVRTSTDYFVRLQKENKAKQKKTAIRQIIFGVAMLVILVVGLSRRRKKKTGE